jgi:uncharacterized DUF497 family protein
MDFDWDDDKNARNVRERAIPFSLAKFIFEKPTLEAVDQRKNYGELRIQTYGLIRDRVFVCVYTDREISSRAIRRIISLRKANDRETRKYHEWIKTEESG